MGKTYKTIKGVKINPRKVWELPMGHTSHRSGSGVHNNKPRRQRTRQAANNSIIKEYE